MRRSAAPSQIGLPFKRPRFMPPVLKVGSEDNGNGANHLSYTCKKVCHDAVSNEKPLQAKTIENSLSKSDNPDANLDLDLSGSPHWEPRSTSNETKSVGLALAGQDNSNHHGASPAELLNDGIGRDIASGNDAKASSLNYKLHDLLDTETYVSGKEFVQEKTEAAKSETKPVVDSIAITRPRFKPFKTPCLNDQLPYVQKNGSFNHEDVSVMPMKNTPESPVASPLECYYNVMWCKLSKKKHKKWEGDAILVTKGRSVTLLDMEGKVIGKGTGYKTKELDTLEEGQTLAIGGKEVEVMGVLSVEAFQKGLCFQGTSTPVSPPSKPTVLSKPFARPMKSAGSFNNEHQGTSIPATSLEVTPRHDPSAPGALVLPRPGQPHQWEHNRNKLPVVDVVVDPYLSKNLRPHQRDGVAFLYECVLGLRNYGGKGAILADEMGLGKTLQCIALVWTLLRQGPYGAKPLAKRVIIITPGSLVKNWAREFKKWLGNERLKVFAIGPDNKVQDFVSSQMYPVMIISYEMFVRTVDVIQQVNFDLVVCDEGHRLKNSNIKTTTLVNSLPTRRRIVLTGTPVQNDLQELFAIVDFCNPGILGSSSGFRRVFEDPIVASRAPTANISERDLGESRAAELNRLTSMFILRRTSDINNKYLPPKVEMVLFCQPSDLQVALYRHLISSRVIRSCFTHGNDPAQHLMCISALKKLCNHPCLIYKNALESAESTKSPGEDIEIQLYKNLFTVYPEHFNPNEVGRNDSGKLSVLAVLMHSMHTAVPQQRVVLVSNYTQTLNILESLCKQEGYSFLRLDGQTPTNKRQQLVERYNSPYSKDFVFLLSSKAGGVGLNLIGASRLVLYDIDWNPANDLQAMARVWRDGQRQKVFIYRLFTTGTLEEKIYQRQISKQGLSGVIVDSKTNAKLHFSAEELKKRSKLFFFKSWNFWVEGVSKQRIMFDLPDAGTKKFVEDLFLLQENTLCGTHELLNCECQAPDQNTCSELSLTRNCQLHLTAVKLDKKNKCMAELMEWHHEFGPAPPLSSVDSVLNDEELQAVTCAFWNENNAAIS